MFRDDNGEIGVKAIEPQTVNVTTSEIVKTYSDKTVSSDLTNELVSTVIDGPDFLGNPNNRKALLRSVSSNIGITIGYDIVKNRGATNGIWQLGDNPYSPSPTYEVRGQVSIDGKAYDVVSEGGTDNKLKEVGGNQKFNLETVGGNKLAIGESPIVSNIFANFVKVTDHNGKLALKLKSAAAPRPSLIDALNPHQWWQTWSWEVADLKTQVIIDENGNVDDSLTQCKIVNGSAD